MPSGYNAPNGYFGLVDEDYILFATEEEYYAFLTERNEST